MRLQNFLKVEENTSHLFLKYYHMRGFLNTYGQNYTYLRYEQQVLETRLDFIDIDGGAVFLVRKPENWTDPLHDKVTFFLNNKVVSVSNDEIINITNVHWEGKPLKYFTLVDFTETSFSVEFMNC